nr:hypothetical protein [Tanacetum cinerariifolium]
FEEERPTTPEPAWSIQSSDMPTSDIATFIDWFCKRRGITELKPQDLEGPAFEIVKVFHPDKKSRESPKTPPGSPPHPPPPPPPPAGPSGASRAPGTSRSSQVPPPLPPPSSTNQDSQSKGSAAPSSSKTAASAEYQ